MRVLRIVKSPYSLIGFLTIIIVCLLLHQSSDSRTRRVKTRLLKVQYDSETQKLQQVLRRAARDDRSVILTIVDQALARPGSILDLFLKSFQIGEGTKRFLNHVVILAVDNQAFQYCNSKHPHCFFLSDPGMKSLSWRNEVLQKVLHLGYHVFFTHADVMWLRNPVVDIDSKNEMAIPCYFSSVDSQSTSDKAGGEFLYVKSDAIAIEYLKYLKMVTVLYPGIHNQSLCQIIKNDDVYGLRIKVLSETHFAGFCQSSWDMSKICTMHANCCDNIESKVHDLKLVLDDWRNFKVRSAENTTIGGSFSSRRPSSKCKV